MGLFDAISGIFSAGRDFITDFGGGAFAAVDERLRGGTLSSGQAAGFGTQFGQAVGNIFGDISTGFITSQLPTGGATGKTSGGRPLANGGATRASLFGFPFPRPGVTASRVGGATEAGLGGALLQILGQSAVDVGLERLGAAELPRIRRGGTTVADRLPGGAVIPSQGGLISAESAIPFAGRVFNTTQNLNTGAVSVRARRLLMFQNPMTGSPVWFKNVGRPILWSGDLATCKRVNRIARRVARRRPR